MRIGIDNYCLHPLNLDPLQTLGRAAEYGAGGVAFSGLGQDQYDALTAPALKEISAFAADHGLYLEWGGGRHIPCDMGTWHEKDIFTSNLKRAREAAALGTRIIRSCSGGFMRWRADSPPTAVLMEKTAAALKDQQQMLADHGVILAIETHFEFTSFELLRIFDMAGLTPGGSTGICLDTLNLLVMLEDPAGAARRLLPWVVSTHIKDGGIVRDKTGLHPFPVSAGTGVVDLAGIIRQLRLLPRPVDLSLEDHGGSFDLPVHDEAFMAGFPDRVPEETAQMYRLADETDKKISRGEISITPRDRWPEVCEARTAAGIKALKRIYAAL